jgi:protease-4
MDFTENTNPSQVPSDFVPPSQGAVPRPLPVTPVISREKKGTGWKIFWGILFSLSVLANIGMFLLLVGMVVFFAAGRESGLVEQVVREGPRTAKIAVVSIQGIIDERQADDFYQQLKAASKDSRVKGVIVRVNSPGGTISGSDQIYNEILKFRDEENKPVVAFMQDVAASGGYYSSVACEKIIAEPTTITGSIGVIMGYLVLEQLLENKLGIQPVVIKAGEKKDWPSSFHAPTDEQLQYLQDRIIGPAYKRFVRIVADGREMLTTEDVNRLADGSIYWADKALEEKLIDQIGYLDDAIDEVKSLAGIKKAQVVEYQKPFSFADILGAQAKTKLSFDRKTLYELTTPQVLYLWTAIE